MLVFRVCTFFLFKMITGVAPSKDSSKLATAAEELIKAACSHVETSSLTIGKKN